MPYKYPQWLPGEAPGDYAFDVAALSAEEVRGFAAEPGTECCADVTSRPPTLYRGPPSTAGCRRYKREWSTAPRTSLQLLLAGQVQKLL